MHLLLFFKKKLADYCDISTNHVIEWLNYYEIPYFRFNAEDRYEIMEFTISNDCNIIKLYSTLLKMEINLSEFTCSWYRRGDIVFKLNSDKQIANIDIRSYISREYNAVKEYIFYFFENIPHLDSYFRRSLNKLMVLKEATRVGFKVPFTKIFTGKLPTRGSIITKAITEGFTILVGKENYGTFTNRVPMDNNYNEILYSVSLIQELIEKEADLRVFYLNGKCYAMAIMSQTNEKSIIDFRTYPADKPNRRLSYFLPENVCNQLKELMTNLRLSTGSIDLILTKQHDYVFLEINPVGQFGMTSFPCNYYLEKQIARSIKVMYDETKIS